MKKQINSKSFSTYTEDSCYWAGFLSADGCIDSTDTIRFELKGEDSYQVEKFRDFLNSEHTISYRESTWAYSFRFKDEIILNDLIYNYSITKDKTFNLELPILPSIDLYKAYFLGNFDGDGCLTEFFNNRPTAAFRVFLTSASFNFLTSSLEYLRNNSIIVGGSIQKKSANCYHIQLGIKDSTSFLNWIYSISNKDLYLSRKFNIYKRIILDGVRAHR